MKKYIEGYLNRLSMDEFTDLINQYLEQDCQAIFKSNISKNLSDDFRSVGSFKAACENYHSAHSYYRICDDWVTSTSNPRCHPITSLETGLEWLVKKIQYHYNEAKQDCDIFFCEDDYGAIAYKAGVLPTKEVCQFISGHEQIYCSESLVRWRLQNEFPELRTRVSIQCLSRFQRIWEFAKSIQMTDSLMDCFNRLSNWNNQVVIASDFIDNCFVFYENIDNGVCGGIVFHGAPESGGYKENGSVMLSPAYGWSIHT